MDHFIGQSQRKYSWVIILKSETWPSKLNNFLSTKAMKVIFALICKY